MNLLTTSSFETFMTILSLLIQITFVLVFCSLAVFFIRKRWADLAHRIWMLGLCGVLFIPFLLFMVRPWTVEVGNWSDGETEPNSRLTMGQNDQNFVVASEASAVNRFGLIGEKTAKQSAEGLEPVSSASSRSGSRFNLNWIPTSPIPWCLAIWGIGAVILLVRLMLAGFELHCLARDSAAADERTKHFASDLKNRMRLRRDVNLHVAGDHRMPVAFWWCGWHIVLPVSSNTWSDELLRSVIAHEMGHVVRGDFATDCLAQLTWVAYWFHPMVWLANRDLRKLRESACDDLVLRELRLSPKTYAHHLLDVVANCSEPKHCLASPISNSKNVEERIQRILTRPVADISRVSLRLALTTVVVAVVIGSSMIQLSGVASDRIVEETGVVDDDVVSAAGQVLDRNGMPLKGATVQLRIVPAAFSANLALNSRNDLMATVETDQRGRFDFRDVPIPNRFRHAHHYIQGHHCFELLANAEGYGLTHLALFNLASESLEIRLKPEGEFYGVVTDQQGKPISGAIVTVVTLADRSAPFSRFARSADHSNLLFSQIAPQAKNEWAR